MFRIPAPSRPVALATAAVATVALLAGCFGVPLPVAPTAKPTPTGFATIDGETPAPIETGAPVEPTAPPADGFTTLTDDLGVLSIQVPSTWVDVDTRPFTTDDGEEWASIAAAPDLDGYLSTWSVPGVEFAGTPTGGIVPDATLTGFLGTLTGYFDADCEPVTSDNPYDDGLYVGFSATWTGCGGGETYGFAIVAQPADGTHAVYVRGQVESPDETATLDAIIGSFIASISRAAR